MADPVALEPGVEISGYRVERALGRGGMGEVWEATQLSLDRRVALKVIAGDKADEPGFEERFRREARMAARVNHDAVLPIFDHGTLDDGRLFLTMRLVEGPDLAELIARRGQLSLQEAVSILLPIAEALDAAHDEHLVHRDVKPSNVLLEPHKGGWRPYLADFGLARPQKGNVKYTRTGQLLGTVDFMAPEQVRGNTAIDGRADVYAFGGLLYNALTGEVPYPLEPEAAVMHAHVHEPPPVPSRLVPDLPEAADRVVQRAMATDPALRAHSAARLMHYLAEQLPPPAETVQPRRDNPTRRVLGFRARVLINLVILGPAFAAAYLIGATF
jgi:eukaryotic-like serine/threonine-protein kinase